MSRLIKNNVRWVGKVDWELRMFHGNELSTHFGSNYNAYLIQEQKTVLIDTVWKPFAAEFIRELAATVDIKKEIRDTKIYFLTFCCTFHVLRIVRNFFVIVW